MSESTIDQDALAEVLEGLGRRQKTLSPKFFYDARGSDLFEQIMRLDEYYPTRTEISILQDHGPEIGKTIGPDAVIVEFGAGNVEKVRLVLDVLEHPRAFVPIDISGEHLNQAAAELADAYPGLAVLPVTGDFTKPMELPDHEALRDATLTGFFPGSTIGNLLPNEAESFLATAREVLRGGDLLIGVDLQKDPEVLNRAYNDRSGVTAAFNLNMLPHLNTLVGADFDPSGFRHNAYYNEKLGRIEMHLVSRKAQTVTVGGQQFRFVEGETIHTESSHKYTLEGFAALAARAGWKTAQTWCDPKPWFSLHLLTPA
jgi:dimethylhistidine N-methyltransferase